MRARFWSRVDEIVGPLVEEARTHTTPVSKWLALAVHPGTLCILIPYASSMPCALFFKSEIMAYNFKKKLPQADYCYMCTGAFHKHGYAKYHHRCIQGFTEKGWQAVDRTQRSDEFCENLLIDDFFGEAHAILKDTHLKEIARIRNENNVEIMKLKKSLE